MKPERKFVHSFSAKKKFLQCTHLFVRDRVNREFPFVQGPEAAEGDRLHKLLQNMINLKTVARGPEGAWATPIVARLREYGGQLNAEVRYGMTKAGKPCAYFDDDVYYRAIIDARQIDEDFQTARVWDWKFGKDTYVDTDQMVEDAILIFVNCPDVQFVVTAIVFPLTGKIEKLEFSREYLQDYLDALLGELHEIDVALENGDMSKQKGPLCPWCPVGAECENWTPPKPKK